MGEANHLSIKMLIVMRDISEKEMNGIEELFASDHTSMRKVHIERAKQDYAKLKELGYISSPKQLRIDSHLWVDVFSYLKPRTKFIEVGENMEIRVLQHPGGLWTYGVSVLCATRGWAFLPSLFTKLYQTEYEAHDTALKRLIDYVAVDKKMGNVVKKLKTKYMGNLQLDLFAGFSF